MHVLTFQKITERFFRNPEKPADEDVAERVFLIPEERIQLRYHCRDDHITASKREFLRRTEVDNKGNKIIMTPDMCISFEVGLGARRGEKKLGSSAPSLRLGETGVETPGSQPGSLSLPLGEIKSSHPGTILFAAPPKIFPFSTKKDSLAGEEYSVLFLPQPWAEQTPDLGTSTGIREDPLICTGLTFLVQILTFLALSSEFLVSLQIVYVFIDEETEVQRG